MGFPNDIVCEILDDVFRNREGPTFFEGLVYCNSEDELDNSVNSVTELINSSVTELTEELTLPSNSFLGSHQITLQFTELTLQLTLPSNSFLGSRNQIGLFLTIK